MAPSDRTFGDGDYEHRQGRSLGSTGISSGRKKIHDPLPPCQINSSPSACNDAGKNIQPEEGIRDFCEVIQEDGGGRTPHFQTGAFTVFSDRRAQPNFGNAFPKRRLTSMKLLAARSASPRPAGS